MTENDILDAIGDIDSAYLEEADGKGSSSKIKWIGFGMLAACFVMLLIFPLGYYQYLWNAENNDYAPEAYKECAVYYVRNGEILRETIDVGGGDAEMLTIWMTKNDMRINVDLRDIGFSFVRNDSEEDATDDYLATVTLPSVISTYFEKDDGGLLLETLKKTIESYRNITINGLELVYS
jgi:hypothetical protein